MIMTLLREYEGFPMNAFSDKLYDFSCRFIQCCSVILGFLLFAGAFLRTCYSEDMGTQLVLTKWDNPFFGILGIAFFLLLIGGMIHFLFRHSGSPVRLLRILALFWCIALGGILIVFGRTVPAADAMSVYSIAESLAAGDTSVIHPTASYLSYYPQQVGLTAFFEMLIRIWRLLPFSIPAYHFIKCIYVGLLCVIICLQEQIVHLLWKNERTDCLYLLLISADLPFIMYSSFVYGEIPSFAAASAGLYCLLKLLALCRDKETSGSLPKKKQLLYIAGVTAGFTVSVMLRKNNLILLIAALIVIFLEWFKNRQHKLLVLGLLCAVCGLSILPLVQKEYELRAGNELSSGVTAASYLAMGMQESSRANGWYNGFNFNTYQDAGLDSELADEVSRQAILDRLQTFREQPGYAAGFYLNKHLSQWADGTYASRQATLATFGGRHSFFVSLYEGSLSKYYIGYCNIYQNVLYLGALICFILSAKKGAKKESAPALFLYSGFIAVLGGFLFHTLWEANSRYIFLYSLLLLPYTAQGICASTQRLSAFISGWRRRKTT
ncbi:MAG: hypothetical protein NC517_13480 [Firmicutes bacterium]|nr:hypothetical protein [Bacillota bacterium]